MRHSYENYLAPRVRAAPTIRPRTAETLLITRDTRRREISRYLTAEFRDGPAPIHRLTRRDEGQLLPNNAKVLNDPWRPAKFLLIDSDGSKFFRSSWAFISGQVWAAGISTLVVSEQGPARKKEPPGSPKHPFGLSGVRLPAPPIPISEYGRAGQSQGPALGHAAQGPPNSG